MPSFLLLVAMDLLVVLKPVESDCMENLPRNKRLISWVFAAAGSESFILKLPKCNLEPSLKRLLTFDAGASG